MQPEIFQIDKDTCYLLYGNYLTVNLPMDRIDACLASLRKGRPYKYPRGILRAYESLKYEGMGALYLCKTFILDGKFRLFIRESPSQVKIRHGRLYCENAGDKTSYEALSTVLTLEKWLADYLVKQGFTYVKRKIKPGYYWGQWLFWLVMFLVIWGLFIANVHDAFRSTIGVVIISAVAIIMFLAVSLVIAVCFATMGNAVTVYTKTTG